ncbi:MAG: hypothetical protein R2713_05140 [Ilumatobacteraceae bacterium]
MTGDRDVNVTSARSPCSGASTTTCRRRSGSTTFTWISPRSVAYHLSVGARCDTKTEVCSRVDPSPDGNTTQNAASAT